MSVARVETTAGWIGASASRWHIRKLVNGTGDVLVVSMAGGTLKSVVAETQMEGFRKGLLAHPRVKIVAVGLPPQTNGDDILRGVPEQFIRDSIQAHPTTKVVVSFLGIPLRDAGVTNANLAATPKVLTLSLGPGFRWTNAVASGLVSVVILPRYDIRWNKLPTKRDCDVAFRTRYEVVTRTKLQSVVARREAFRRAQGGPQNKQ